MKKELFAIIGEWSAALAAAVVLYVIPVTGPTLHNGLTTAKYFTLLPLLVIFAAAVTLHTACRLRHRTASYRLTATDAVAALGIVWYLLNTALWGAADSMRLIFAAGMGVWYAGLRLLFTSERIFRILLLILLLVVGYEAVLGILQSCGERVSNHALYAATGTFYNPGPYGGFLAVFLPVALYGMVDNTRATHALYRWVACSVFFLSLVILPVTMNRTAWAAALAGCGAVLAVRYYPALNAFISRHRKLSLGAALAAAVILAAGAIAIWHLKRDSAEGRLLIWKNSARIIGKHPVLGCGFGRFAGAYGEKQASYFAVAPRAEREISVAGTPDDAFNEYLQITTEGGLVGGLLFVLAAGLCLGGLWKRRASTDGLFFGAVSLSIFAFASYPFSLAEFLLAGVFLLAAAAPTTPGVRVNRYTAFLFWTIGVLPFTFVLWLHEKPREKAYREWRTDHMMYGMKLYEQVARSAKEQYPLLKAEPAFLYEYGHSLHFTGDYVRSNAILNEGSALSADPMFRNVMGNNYKALGDAERAESCYLKAYYTVPNRIYPLYLLAKLYRETGQTDKLLPMCRRVLNFKEKVTSPATAEIKREAATWLSENQ